MPVITSVEPQKKNTRRFNIYLDGNFAFGADEDLVVNQRLLKGKKIEPQDLEKLLFESEVGKLMERMYGLFSRRSRSEKEVRDYLRNLNFKRKLKDQENLSEVVIASLIQRLKEKQLLNDTEFAKAWFESRQKSKKKGVNALKQELYQKGIDRDTIQELIENQTTTQSEEALAKEALEKKMRIWKNLPPQEFKKKALEFLVRRGFDYSVAKDVVDNAVNIG